MKKGFLLSALTAFAVLVMASLSPAAHAGDSANRVVFQINQDDPALMNLLLNNVNNVKTHYLNKGEEVEIEVVAYGPGLTMLLADKSPVAQRLTQMTKSYSDVTFSACGNTMKGITKKTGKEPQLHASAHVVPAGVIRLMELQQQGWTYIKP